MRSFCQVKAKTVNFCQLTPGPVLCYNMYMDDIEEAITETVEAAVEEAVEAVEEAVEETPAENSETPHVVSLEERFSECLQQLGTLQAEVTALQSRLPQVEAVADQAEATAELAIDLAVSSNQEPELSEPEQVEIPPPPPEPEKKVSFWEALLGGR